MNELLTIREVAEQLRVDDTTVRRWIKNGILDAITLPHSGKRQAYRVRSSVLQKILGEGDASGDGRQKTRQHAGVEHVPSGLSGRRTNKF